MKEMALLFGALLIALGLYAYFVPVNVDDGQAGKANTTDVQNDAQSDNDQTTTKADEGKKKKTSPTALIPAAFGCLFLLFGTLANLSDGMRKHMMHAAAAVGLFGALAGLGMGLTKIGAVTGDDPKAQRAALVTLGMGVLCLVYVVLSIRSFIAARKAREAAEAAEPES